jgi:hypothetical protein
MSSAIRSDDATVRAILYGCQKFALGPSRPRGHAFYSAPKTIPQGVPSGKTAAQKSEPVWLSDCVAFFATGFATRETLSVAIRKPRAYLLGSIEKTTSICM